MKNLLGNLALEISVLVFFGMLYYFYQKRKILHFEENKNTIVMNMILEACLAEKTSMPQPELDHLISGLDDFLQNKTSRPPINDLKKFMETEACSVELKETVAIGLKELAIAYER